MKFAINSLA